MKKVVIMTVLALTLAPLTALAGMGVYVHGGYLKPNIEIPVLNAGSYSTVVGVQPGGFELKELGGIAFGGGIELPLAPMFSTGLDVSYYTETIEGGFNGSGTYLSLPFTYDVKSSTKVTLIPVLATLTVRPPMGKVSAYARLGAGLVSYKEETTVSVSASIPSIPTFGGAGALPGVSESGYGVLLSGGLSMKLVPTLSVFAEGGYLLTGVKYATILGGENTVSGVQAKVGLRFSVL